MALSSTGRQVSPPSWRPWAVEQGLELDERSCCWRTPTTRRRWSGRPRQRCIPGSWPRPSAVPVWRWASRSVTDGRAGCGGSVPDWPAFPDSSEALARLANALSAHHLVQRAPGRFRRKQRAPARRFAAIITAEDVGAYKPAENHFRALDATLPELGLDRSELLHVAQSLFHDHVPAKREGLPSVWINRRHDRPGWGATPEPAGSGPITWSSLRWPPSPTPSTLHSPSTRANPPAFRRYPPQSFPQIGRRLP